MRAREKGQGILEFTTVIIVVIVFLGGIIKIWLWANEQMVRRQLSYNAGRVDAGRSSEDYSLQWPVYSPQSLTEEDVLRESPIK